MSLVRSYTCQGLRLSRPQAAAAATWRYNAAGRRATSAVVASADASAAAAATTSGAAAAVASTPKSADVVTVYFRQEGTSTTARPGEDFMDVASRCKADIPTGCLHGSCGVCEVELFKYAVDEATGEAREAGSPVVMRACVAKVPRGWGRVEVGMMAVDQVWGQDGWDT
ncbi:hypothetical protein HYH02_011967 [Chlamydomonas schloesseri]|uniref:2Fe-2S ferredoxin-type domain-containing protein n=1 Tax=Chlamydomonas schloesseri TaxID=2026947 RepID=A0A835T1U4_9CHLO|nr:hypothetical protein HYH02_011967 [Chlamydomonas schloesseri]|eukprot:KAG2435467.1 hypothetical protein HYH02_011967 [Chlamydomonas schloesseri]